MIVAADDVDVVVVYVGDDVSVVAAVVGVVVGDIIGLC